MGLVTTGSVLGTFGLEGCIKVVSCSGEYEHLFALDKVYVSFSKRKLVSSKYKDDWFWLEDVKVGFGFALLKLKSVDVMEDARCFIGAQLLVEEQDVSILREGEYHAFELCSCSLFLSGSKVGKVLDVMDGGAGVLLEVEKNDGISCYIPFNDEFINKVDIAQKTIEIKNEWIMQ